METDIFYKQWKTFLTKCIFLQFSICKKAENVKKNHNLSVHVAQKQNVKLELLTKLTFNGKLHKIGTQKKRKEVVIRRNYQSS